MRVADKMNYSQMNNNIQKNRSEMMDLQNQAATQKRINKPSDDPTASTRVLVARTEERGANQFVKNINAAKSFLEYTDQSLSELADSLVRTKELAIQQANDAGASGDTRRVVAAEVEQIYFNAIQIGNRKLGDRFIFGGYQTTRNPFASNGEYAGDDGHMKVQINKDAFVPMNIPGDKVFLGKGLGNDGLIKPNVNVPRDSNELTQMKQDEYRRLEANKRKSEEAKMLRSTASMRGDQYTESVPSNDQNGVNVLEIIKNFEIALKVNDKAQIQDSIETLDSALTQVINARSQVGSRIQTLDSTLNSLQKSIVDNKIAASNLEDADVFQVMSDITKADSTLRATLETSGKVSNKSLMDFLR